MHPVLVWEFRYRPAVNHLLDFLSPVRSRPVFSYADAMPSSERLYHCEVRTASSPPDENVSMTLLTVVLLIPCLLAHCSYVYCVPWFMSRSSRTLHLHLTVSHTFADLSTFFNSLTWLSLRSIFFTRGLAIIPVDFIRSLLLFLAKLHNEIDSTKTI